MRKFAGVRLACRELNIPSSTLSNVLSGRTKSLNGKGWRYDIKEQKSAKLNFIIDIDETWYLIPGHPRYLIDHWANVYSEFKKDLMTPQINIKGYHMIHLYSDGVKYLLCLHRLMAQCFIPNPENKPMVNHIDGNPANNRLENLEWVTNSENIKHAIKLGLQKTVAVIQYDMEMNELARFPSVNAASRASDTHATRISKVCRGKRASVKGYIWRYVSPPPDVIIDDS